MFIKLNQAEIEDASEKLDFIYSHYRGLCGNKEGVDVFVNEHVAREVSRHCESRNWSQRYFVSLKNNKYPPGRLAYGAIVKKHEQIIKDAKPPKPKLLPHQVGKRTLVVDGTLYNLHRVQEEIPDTGKRLNILLDHIGQKEQVNE